MSNRLTERVFVYHDDDYAENGGIGLEICLNREAAAKFITSRLAENGYDQRKRTIDNYIVIQGWQLSIVPEQYATRLKLEDMDRLKANEKDNNEGRDNPATIHNTD